MASKKKTSFFIPTPLMREIDRIAGRVVDAKKKGVVVSAALQMFIEADTEQQRQYVEKMLLADVRDAYETLADEAKTLQAQKIIDRETKKSREPPLKTG